MRISDWSSDVCSSDLRAPGRADPDARCPARPGGCLPRPRPAGNLPDHGRADDRPRRRRHGRPERAGMTTHEHADGKAIDPVCGMTVDPRSEEHTSELQPLMGISYAVFCLKKKTTKKITRKCDTGNARNTHYYNTYKT